MTYITPQLTEDSISQIYSTIYSSKSENLSKKVQPQHMRILKSLNALKPGRGTLLDVGCFEGDFLNVAKDTGWNVFGTEISKKAISSAKSNYGINVDKGRLIYIKYKENQFDVVTMNDVIEHLPNPNDYVSKVSKILKSGGIFYIGTPNFDSLPRYLLGKSWHAVIFPWHLQYFSINILIKLLKDNGFEIKLLSTRNFLLKSKDPYDEFKYITSGSKVTEKTFTSRALNFALNKLFNILFYILDQFHIYLGAQIELYAVKK